MSKAGNDQIIDKTGLEFTPDQAIWVKQVQDYYTQAFIYDEAGIKEVAELGQKLRASVPLELTCGDYYLGSFGFSGQEVYLLGGVPTVGSLFPCPVCDEPRTFDRNGQVYCVPCGGYVGGKTNGNR